MMNFTALSASYFFSSLQRLCLSPQKELIAKAEKEFQARKRELLERMRSAKDATFTPAELAILEDSDNDAEEAELQKMISEKTVDSGAITGSAAGTVYNPSAEADADIKSHVNVPSQQDINELLLVEKRKALLARLSSL